MLRPLLGLAIILGSLLLLAGAFTQVEQQIGDPLPDAAARGIEAYLERMRPEDAQRLQAIWNDLSPDQQEQLLKALAALDDRQLEDLVDVFEELDPQDRAALLDAMEQVQYDRTLETLTLDQRRRLEAMRNGLSATDAAALDGLLGAMSGQDPGSVLEERSPRTLDSRHAGGLTGDTGSDPLPGPDTPGAFAPDRGGEGDVTCYAVFEPYLACAKRWQVLDRIDSGYVLSPSPSHWEPVASGSASGTSFTARYPVVVEAGTVTPIYSVAPDQVVRSFFADGPGSAVLVRDGRDVYGVQADRSGTYQLTMRLVDGTAYRAGIPDADRASLPPAPEADPALVAQMQPWLEANGYWERDDVGAALRELQAMFRSFEGGAPLSAAEQPDFFLAVVQAEQGCCRHFATAFVAASQAMGVHSRAVYNEGHMFAEVLMPQGWVEVQLGGCGGYDLEGEDGRTPAASATNDELLATPRQRDDPPSGDAIATVTTITFVDPLVEKDRPFDVRGRVTAGDGLAAATVHLYANETKRSPGVLLGSTETDSEGDWALTVRFPETLPAGRYQLVAEHPGTVRGVAYAPSWSDPPITVHSPSRIVPSAPEHAGAGQAVRVSARLVDGDGVGVPGEVLHVDDGHGRQAAVTDTLGEATFMLGPYDAGERRIGWEYKGSDHLDPSATSTSMTVLDIVFTPSMPEPLRVAAGSEWTLTGTISSQGQPVADTPFSLTWPDGEIEVNSGADGVVEATLTSGVGRSWVRIDGPVGPVANLEVWAQQAARLDLLSPHYADDGRSAVVVQWSGTQALEGIPLQTPAGTVWTDAEGRAEIMVSDEVEAEWAETPGYTAGRLQQPVSSLTLRPGEGTLRGNRLSIPFDGAGDAPLAPTLRLGNETMTGAWDGDTMIFQLPSGSTPSGLLDLGTGFPGHRVTTSYVVVAPEQAPWPWWIAGLALIAVLAGAGVWSVRSGRWRALRPSLRLEVAAQGRPTGALLAASPGQAWRIEIQARSPHGDGPVPAHVRWSVGLYAGRLRAPGGIDLPALPEGTHEMVLRVRGGRFAGGRHRATLHVGSWTEHLRTDYGRLEAEAKERSGQPGLTPSLVAAVLDDRARGPLLEAIRLYEATAFGNKTVDQTEWERFARATLREPDRAL